MVKQEVPGDYIVATGIGATVRDFCQIAFDEVGLDWEKYTVIDPTYFRPTEVDALIGDSKTTQQKLGWEPRMKWDELARLMVRADVEDLK